MFKMFVLIVSLTASQPVGVLQSDETWATKEACEAKILETKVALQAEINPRVPGGVTLIMKCDVEGTGV